MNTTPRDVVNSDNVIQYAQAPLSLRWETRDRWRDLDAEFGGGETAAAMILALVTANGWVSYSRREGHYRIPRRYRSRLYAYAGIVRAADRLASMGLIHHDRAPPGRLGWQSAMAATPELMGRANQIIGSGPPLRIALPAETIILRDAAGRPIDYRDSRTIKAKRRRVAQFNEAIRSVTISHFAAAPLVRIYNGSLARGGRFYAQGDSWQNMDKNERKRITIDGEPVVEIDFKTLHPAILYADFGVELPLDCYDIDGWPRPVAKVALLILINASTEHSARYAIAHHEAMAGVAKPGSQQALQKADRLIRDLKRVHRPIAAAFHSDVGARLMLIDSDLAEMVMWLMHRRGVAILPVHDSFLVPASKADLSRRNDARGGVCGRASLPASRQEMIVDTL